MLRVVFFVWVGLSVALSAAELQFQKVVIDDTGLVVHPHCMAVGDIDGDGFPDLLAGGGDFPTEPPNNVLVWYREPDWNRTVIQSGDLYTVDMQVGDVDGDGDLDAIIPRAGGSNGKPNQLVWYENPRPTGDPSLGPWVEHIIGDLSPELHGEHDLEIADIDGDGKLDVVSRKKGGQRTSIWFQNDPNSFTEKIVSIAVGEGTSIGDLDNDGDLDLLQNGFWLEAPEDPRLGTWGEHPIASDWPPLVGVRIADVNGDGKNDVVFAPSESEGRFSWYETSDPINGPWTEHVIDESVSYFHTFQVFDIDFDGDLDFVTAEMHQSVDPDEVSVYYNEDGLGLQWHQQVVGTSGAHNIRVVDIGNDGDLDIYGANWSSDAPDGGVIKLWENLSGPPAVSLDRWELHLIDGGMPWAPLVVDAKDLDGDGRLDLVAGGWWYRNPGSIQGDWVRQAIGGPLNNMAWVDDFDGDGDWDMVGTDGTPYGGGLSWAQNNGSGGFTIYTNLDYGRDTFFQGAIAAVFYPGGPLQYVMQWEDGELGLSGVEAWNVPANPTTETWTKHILHPTSLGEQLSAGDIDGDGDLDLFQGSSWLRNEGLAGWTHIPIAQFPPAKGGPDRNRLADIDNDGDLDAVVGFSHFTDPDTHLLWLENPADPTQPWPQHVVVDGVWGGYSLDVGDIDFDGDIDIVLGEHRGATRAFIYENVDGGSTWIEHMFDPGAPGRDHHDSTLLFDLDDDGDFDIVSMGWDNHKLWIFENTTPHVPDSQAPSVPSNLVARAVASFQVDLSWSASSDNRLVTRYLVFRDGVVVGNTPGDLTTFSDRGLTPETEYTYAVVALDSSGNQSGPSAAAASTTLPADFEAPSIPQGVMANALSSSHVELSWEASTDNTEVSFYRVFRDGTDVGTISTTFFIDSGLRAETPYSYTVSATDISGNESAVSAPDGATTLPTPPVPLGGLALWLRADIGVMSDGLGIGQWIDQSGQNRHAAQGLSANRPALRTSAAGFPVVGFDGVDDFLAFELPVNGLTGMSVFLVAANTENQVAGPSQGERAALFWNESSAWGTVYLTPFQSMVNFRFGTTQAGNQPFHRRLSSVGGNFTLTAAVKNGTVDSCYVNGTLVLAQDGKLAAIAGCRDTGNVGRGYNDDSHYAGEIAEILVYTQVLTEADRRSVEEYLSGKYGLVLPLLPLLPQILEEPFDVTVGPPAPAVFTVSASGALPLAYQWRRGGVDLPGRTGTSYVLEPTTAADDGATFDVVVSNGFGSVTSGVATLSVSANVASTRVTGGLVVLYDFAEGSGTTVRDVSGAGSPLDLTILDPARVQWLGTSNGVKFVSAGSAIRSPGAGTKIHNSLRASGRVSFEAWLTPDSLAQTGPARIATVSEGTASSQMSLHVGQGRAFGEGDIASFRLRTSANSFSWLQAGGVFNSTVNARHVVVTYDGTAQRVYVDGVLSGSGQMLSGDFSNWTGSYPFMLGNEATLNRSWLGSLFLVAVYDRALSPAEVQQNFAVGLQTGSAPPQITTQPVNVTLTAPAPATFGVAATGMTPLTYQWRRGGVNIGGATGSSYTLNPTTAGDNGAQFSVVVGNAAGSVTSGVATLSVSGNMASTRVTGGLVVLYDFAEGGGTTVHDVSGVGSPLNLTILDPTRIQWLGTRRGVRFASGGSAIRSPGAGTKIHNTLTASSRVSFEAWLTPDSLAQTGPARIATVSEGAASSQMSLHVGQGGAFGEGDIASFRLRTSNNSFSWLQAGGVFNSTVNARHLVVTYDGTAQRVYVDGVLSGPVQMLSGDFSTWTATYPFVLGNEATLNRSWLGSLFLVAVYDRALSPSEVQQNFAVGLQPGSAPPQITTQPVDRTVLQPAPALFSVVATGTVSYQWRRGGVDVVGATGSSYTLNPTSAGADHGAEFDVVVSNGFGSVTSVVATLTVNAAAQPPNIATQPASVSVTAPASATFSVVASGAPPFSYQWRRSGVSIGGATGSSYTLASTTAGDNGAQFSVVVGNVGGSVTSVVATLSVSGNMAGARVTGGLVVLYDFAEGSGTIVHDVSGVGSPLDLTILDPARIQWLGTSKGVRFVSGGSAIRSPGAGAKIHDALTASSRLSMEAWLRPDSLDQVGPARIATLSEGTASSQMNMHLGQGGGDSGGDIGGFRLRTSGNSFSWLQAGGVLNDTVSARHVVVTYDGTAQRVYVDGVLSGSVQMLSGDFSNWTGTYPFVLGNEATLNRSWLGSLFLVAVYDRALSPSEVQQNFVVGPQSGSAPPQIRTQPANVTVTAPAPATFSVVATGTPPLNFQWRRGGANIGGATGSSYTLNPTTAGDNGGQFSVVVSNGSGSVTSGVATFSVLELGGVPPAGLALWLRADLGVVGGGSRITQWNDQSGNNRHAAQGSAGSQPELVVEGGNPVVRFDGVNDYLGFALPVNGLTGMTLFLVAANTQDQNGGFGPQRAAIFWNEVQGWGTVFLSPFQRSVSARFGTTQSGNQLMFSRPVSVGLGLTITTALKEGATDSIFVNGALVLSQSGKFVTIAGCRNVGNLGRGYNDDTFYAGDIAEVIVYDRALPPSERTTVEAYLANKYGSQPTGGAGGLPTEPLLEASPSSPDTVQVRLVGQPGTVYLLESSADLVHWVPVKTVSLGSSSSWSGLVHVAGPLGFLRARVK